MTMQRMTNPEEKKPAFDARIVKDAASGHWLSIIESLCPGLDKAVQKAPRHVGCPVHGGTDGFRLFKDAAFTGGGCCNTCGVFSDGFELIMWYRDEGFYAAVTAVAQCLGLAPESASFKTPRRTTPSPEMLKRKQEQQQAQEQLDQKLRDDLKRIWSEAVYLDDPSAEPVRLYLARRGLGLEHAIRSKYVKYHPDMPYFDDKEEKVIGSYPCMIALCVDSNGKPVTLHRTYLTWEGRKAPVSKAKKLMAYPSDRILSGGSIPLVGLKTNLENGGRAIGLTEGIETALAVIEATKGMLPVFPVISATLLENFVVPTGVSEVFVYGDQDANDRGRDATAKILSSLREQGISAKGYLPRKEDLGAAKSLDWLDILVQKGPEAIPTPEVLGVAQK